MKILSLLVLTLCIATQHSYADQSSFTVSGIMLHTDLEGGCWYLEATNGRHYELVGDTNLINPLHEQGRQVDLLVRPATGRASICMVGDIVEVIEQVTTPRHPVDLTIAPMLLNGRMHRKQGTWYVRTKEGAQFEFKNSPARKYRKENARINTPMRVLLDKNSSKLHMDGVVLPPATQKVVGTNKNIPVPHDPR